MPVKQFVKNSTENKNTPLQGTGAILSQQTAKYIEDSFNSRPKHHAHW